MPALENLIATIKTKGEMEAREILENSKKEIEIYLQKNKETANGDKDRIIHQGEKAAAEKKEALIHQKRLQARDDLLLAKRRMIAEVLQKAIEIVSQMTMEEFEEYVEKTILTAPEHASGSLVVPRKFMALNIEKISKGSQRNITLEADRHVENGFIFISQGIEYNNTFSGLLEFHQADLELFIAHELF